MTLSASTEPDALHSRPYGQNPADPFIADNGWKRGAECVDALCDHEVVRVDEGILDADEDPGSGTSTHSKPSTGLPKAVS
jgi:hypothetical protein